MTAERLSLKAMEEMKRQNIVVNIIVYFAFLLIVFSWFAIEPRYSVMFGDDLLYLYSEIEDKSFFDAVFNISQNLGKYRPVLFAVLYLPVKLFKTNVQMYQVLNTIGLSFVAFFGYALVEYITKNSIIGFLSAILIIVTPFNAYSVGVVFGMMEILCVLQIIAQVYFCVRLFETGESKWIVGAWISFFLCVFTAERFMALLPCFWGVIFLMRSPSKNMWKRIAICLLFTIPIIFRQMLLASIGVNGLETGRGSAFDLIKTLPIYAWKAIVNIAGFALGDAWHGGFQLNQLSFCTVLLASLNVFLFIGLLCYFAHYSISEFTPKNKGSIYKKIQEMVYSQKVIGYVLILALFFVMNLIPYALVAKTHGEDRFLFPAYIILVFIVAAILNTISKKKLLYGLVALMFLARLGTDVDYKIKKEWIHWKYSYRTAQSCYDTILQKHNKEDIQAVYFVYPGTDYHWIFADQMFMQYYLHEDVQTFYVDSLTEVPIDEQGKEYVYVVPNKSQDHPFESMCVTYDELAAYDMELSK